MNLAPLRYRRVFSALGGPVRNLECGTTTVMGQRVFQANAYLRAELRSRSIPSVIFGNPDGTGTAMRPSVARHKAVSEALERWAHAALHRAPEGALYGFDVDPSSNGMAAFPGMFPREARTLALREAAERFSIIGWWSGALDASFAAEVWPGVECFEVENPLSSHVAVILHASAGPGIHAYGFGAADTRHGACMHAAVELVRSQFVLQRYNRLVRQGHDVPVRGLFESRCLYFSSDQGHRDFRQRMERPKWRSVEPRIVFDGEIPGPWSDFACVWRVALEPASPDFLDPVNSFFFW
jgi:hypothetical protein